MFMKNVAISENSLLKVKWSRPSFPTLSCSLNLRSHWIMASHGVNYSSKFQLPLAPPVKVLSIWIRIIYPRFSPLSLAIDEADFFPQELHLFVFVKYQQMCYSTSVFKHWYSGAIWMIKHSKDHTQRIKIGKRLMTKIETQIINVRPSLRGGTTVAALAYTRGAIFYRRGFTILMMFLVRTVVRNAF